MLPSPTNHMDVRATKLQGSSSRILYDIPCRVCQDHSSGKHYGIFACDGCAGFFKRSIRRNRQYVCKAKVEGTCLVDKTHRNQCRACRLSKCVQAGMNKEAVQHERGPRTSTLRRQMSLYYKTEPCDTTTDPENVNFIQSGVLNLALPRSRSPEQSPVSSSHFLPPMPSSALLSHAGLLSPKIPTHIPTSHTTQEGISEAAARLLFHNVQWMQTLPYFLKLHPKDQVLLLEEGWREMFMLGAAQCLLSPQVSKEKESSRSESDSSSFIAQEYNNYQEVLLKFKQLQVDFNEYFYLRMIVLFKTCIDSGPAPSSNASSSSSEVRSLLEPAIVSSIQDQAQAYLSRYIASAYPTQPFRFGKLLLLLPSLKSVSAAGIEELFFTEFIGNISIERIICDMYRGRAVGHTQQSVKQELM